MEEMLVKKKSLFTTILYPHHFTVHAIANFLGGSFAVRVIWTANLASMPSARA